MKKVITSLLLGLGLVVLPTAGMAEVTPEGFYVGGDLGLTLPGHTHLGVEWSEPSFPGWAAELKSGFMFTGGVKFGYAFGLDRRVSPRAELAINYGRGHTKMDLDNVGDDGIDEEMAMMLNLLDGQTISYWSVMANAIFDINVGQKFFPYVGAGFGMLYLRPSFDLEIEGQQVAEINATISRMQVQLILGGGYNINPNLGLFGEFRLTSSSGLGLKANLNEIEDFGLDGKAELNLLLRPGMAFSLGLRYSF